MSTLTLLTRLQLNWTEVSGVARAFLNEPSQVIDNTDLPAVYPYQLGRMNRAIPTTSTTNGIPLGAGAYVVERQFGYRLLVGPQQAASTDSGNDGAYVDALAVSIIDAAIDYFAQHPRLSTSTLGDLGVLAEDVQIMDSGLVTRLGPGGGQYRAIDYTITILERRIPATKRLS